MKAAYGDSELRALHVPYGDRPYKDSARVAVRSLSSLPYEDLVGNRRIGDPSLSVLLLLSFCRLLYRLLFLYCTHEHLIRVMFELKARIFVAVSENMHALLLSLC